MRSLASLCLATMIGCDGRSRPPSDAGPIDAGSRDAVATDGGDENDAGSRDTGTGPDLIECAAGSTLLHYSLSPLSQLPPVSELEFTGLPNGAQVLSAGTGDSTSARFDVCRDASGAHSLQGLLWVTDSFSAPSYFQLDENLSSPVEEFVEYRGGQIFRIRLPAALLLVTGLDEALSGVLEPLEVRFVHDSGLLLLGHADFIAGVNGQVGPNTITYTSLYVVAGGLAPGDVFTSRRCPLGESPLSASFVIGTADFSAEACTFLGGGHTTGYRIHRLTVTDSNSALTQSERETFTFEGEDAVEVVMNYVWNHHNACDSFHLALPHADYAATSAPLAGCGVAVPNAPMRDINDDPSGPVQYRVRYHGGGWTEGTITGCTHYMFCP